MPIILQNGGFSAPNFVFWEYNFSDNWATRIFFRQAKISGVGNCRPPPASLPRHHLYLTAVILPSLLVLCPRQRASDLYRQRPPEMLCDIVHTAQQHSVSLLRVGGNFSRLPQQLYYYNHKRSETAKASLRLLQTYSVGATMIGAASWRTALNRVPADCSKLISLEKIPAWIRIVIGSPAMYESLLCGPSSLSLHPP